MDIYNTCDKFNCYNCNMWEVCKPHTILKVGRDTLIKNDKNVKVEFPKLKGDESK